APAPRNLPESVSFASYSSVSANSSPLPGSQPQVDSSVCREQTALPYCVIFSAVHFRSRILRINPAATLVFPIFRECPPTTTTTPPENPVCAATTTCLPIRQLCPT